ncbi:hypothetical protein ACOME3_000071 [Neoechinorhynchus agilis]
MPDSPVDDLTHSSSNEKRFRRQLSTHFRPEEEEELSKKDIPSVKRDADGTEYEWDEHAKGYFPKISEEYLFEHHMNYGFESEQTKIRFDSDLGCYVYEDKSRGISLKHDVKSNQWIPVRDYGNVDNRILETYIDVATGIEYKWTHNQWIPSVSSFVDDRTGQSYIWISDKRSFVPSQLVKEYTDHLSGISYVLTNGQWKEKARKREAKEPEWFEMPDEKNCNVYVSGLGQKVTEDEFRELMVRYGLIASDPRTNKAKLKLYRDKDGNPKGDGLCTYMRVESVDLCLKLLDGMRLADGRELNAQRAKFEMKGSFDPGLKKQWKNRSKKDKLKSEKAAEKLLAWDDDHRRPKHERIIVLRNLYEPSIAQTTEGRMLIFGLRDQVKSMVEMYEPVDDIRTYPEHRDALMTVALSDSESADRCVNNINNRVWNGRLIKCSLWDGKTKFDQERDEVSDDVVRIKKWHEFIEKDE